MLQEDADADVVTSKKKGAKLRTRKSIGGKKVAKRTAGSDSEEEFKPIKAPIKRKPAAEKAAPAPKPTAKIEELDDDEPAVVKKKPVASSSKVKKVESDSDSPMITAPAATKAKGKAVKRKRLAPPYLFSNGIILTVSSNSEEDEDSAPASKAVKKPKSQPSVTDFFDSIPAKKPAAKTKAPIKKIMSSDDEDESMVILDDASPPPVAKRPSRPAAKAKSKYVELSTDGDDNDDDDAYDISD